MLGKVTWKKDGKEYYLVTILKVENKIQGFISNGVGRSYWVDSSELTLALIPKDDRLN